ncbi:hypothetical protein N0V94_006980 [Neodidymelliopsis sp. IMI 364377]|nr:hypothetical protein N0V94_006980 [Neodidymelliopsis sp. IMI 364377]
MDIHHQAPKEVPIIDMETICTRPNGVPRYIEMSTPNTAVLNRTVAPTPPVTAELDCEQASIEAERLAAAERARAQAEYEELTRLFHVSSEDWAASQKHWRDWVESRNLEHAPLDPRRFHVPVGLVEWQKKEQEGMAGEARFSEVRQARHENCMTCKAVRLTMQDPRFDDATRAARLQRLEHIRPRLRVSGSVESLVSCRQMGKLNAEDLNYIVDQSAWEDQPIKNDPENGPMADPAYLLRAQRFRQNVLAIEKAVESTESCQRLSMTDRRSLAKSITEVWELKKDIARLEGILKTVRVQADRVCPSNAEDARTQRSGCGEIEQGLAQHILSTLNVRVSEDDAEELRDKKGKNCGTAVNNSINDVVEELSGEKEQAMRNAPADLEAVEPLVEGKHSPSPLNLDESPEQRTRGDEPAQALDGSTFYDTMLKFHQQTGQDAQFEQDQAAQDNAQSFSTESGPFKYNATRESSPNVAALGNQGSASKGKKKKDSKTEELIGEDGVSMKEFATNVEEKKSRRMSRISYKAGAKPAWR